MTSPKGSRLSEKEGMVLVLVLVLAPLEWTNRLPRLLGDHALHTVINQVTRNVKWLAQLDEYVSRVRCPTATRVREHSSRTGNGSTLSFSSYTHSLLRPPRPKPNFPDIFHLDHFTHIHQNKSILSTHTSAPTQTPATLHRSGLDNPQPHSF